MATSEIEKLERRYAENPHGLTFAPLAEVHRKNGDVARALELLTAGLELHPNYIPASIVLGRCHQDAGDLAAAEAAFAHVLRLDDENVIALKSLADIGERLERYDDAESWLRRLVSVDRSNEEAREQLRRLELAKNGRPAKAEAPAEPVAEPPKRPSAEVVAQDPPTIELAVLDHAEPALTEPAPSPSSPPESAPLVLDRPPEFAELKAEKVESITELPTAAEADAVAPMPGLISQEFEAPSERLGPPAESLGIDLETSGEVVLGGSGSSEYKVANAAEELADSGVSEAAGLPEFRVPDATEEFRAAAEARAAAAARAEAEARAAAEERAAAEKRAAEAAERAAEEERATAERRAAAEERDSAAAAPQRYSARETRGQSVAVFFRGMLAARPPENTEPSGAASAAPEGEASRPAQDGLSLSFDDFFGSPAKGSAAEKGADPGNDDLDQFHSWLQNLKR